MKAYGIIAEYNPFHNGHLYQIQETRRLGATHIIAIMSGNFVQRGDTAIIDKFKRAELAIKCGADIVIELPTPYAMSTAEFFAVGAVSILNSLGCVDSISFGSECGDISLLKKASHAVQIISNSDDLKTFLKSGVSYPSAMQKLVRSEYGKEISDILSNPNNLLGIEYLKAIEYFNSDINTVTIQRKSVPHDSSDVYENISSASYIRNAILNKSAYNNLIPKEIYNVLEEYKSNNLLSCVSNLENTILYKLRTMTTDEILKIPDVSQGLEGRIFSAAKSSSSLEELMFAVKTKRYPLARIRRIILSALIGADKKYFKIFPPYARILALNKKGCEILKAAQKISLIPISTSLLKLSKINSDTKLFAEFEANATDIYALSTKKIQPCGLEYTAKIQLQ